MNKTKKIVMAAVSVAMAGTLALGLFGCGGGSNKKGPADTSNAAIGVSEGQTVVKVKNGDINYTDSYARSAEVTLNMATGHNNYATGISFKNSLTTGEMTMPDGKKYTSEKLKPTWQQISDDLNIKFNDVYGGNDTASNFEKMLTSQGADKYENVDVFTSDLSKVVDQIAKGKSVLNLGNYLDNMPHFKAFLESNPVTYLSLLQEGFDTETGEDKALYVAPYFDGNDDIERYYLIRKDWAEKILNGDAALSDTVGYAADATTAVVPEFTENYEIESLKADGNGTQKIKKDYAAAKSAVTGTGALHDAYAEIAGSTAYDGTTGNIVEIMNKAIAANPAAATGDKLAKLYRAYIDVAYKVGNKAAYTAATRANVFNGYDACWDADDLVAILRIATKSGQALTGSATVKVNGIVTRDNTYDRTPDLVSLLAQLYGSRGSVSRYETTYLDNDGVIHDARYDEAFYKALEKGNKLYQEGLILQNFTSSHTHKGALNGTASEGFMMYDYVQTQTGEKGFDLEVEGNTNPYNLAAVINPVAKWNDGSEKIMRFTESWRSCKTGGIALNGKLAEAGNEAKLLAALQLVDYIYSQDGQIVTTFGPMCTGVDDNGDGTGGYWYNEEGSGAGTFKYKGKSYKGTEYKGNYTPTITQKVYNSFLGKRTLEPDTEKPCGLVDLTTASGKTGQAKKSFTNYARMLIGSTLPMCVKDQSFEYQLTPKIGRDGAFIVGVALDKGIIKHVTPNLAVENGALKAVTTENGKDVKLSCWYIELPSGLPLSATDNTSLVDGTQTQLLFTTGKYTGNGDGDKKTYWSVYQTIVMSGYGTKYQCKDGAIDFAANNVTSAATMANYMKTNLHGSERLTIHARGWNLAKDYALYLFK